MSASIEHRDGAGAEAGDGIDSATATTSLRGAGGRATPRWRAPPPGWEKKLVSAHERQHAKLVKEFILKVKRRFPLSGYKQFLKILHDYDDQQITVTEVDAKFSELFRDHNDLLVEVGQFLPEETTGFNCARAEKILTAFRSKVGDDAYNAVRGILDEFRMGCKNGDCISDCAGRVRQQLPRSGCSAQPGGPSLYFSNPISPTASLHGPSRLKGDWDCVLCDDLLATLRSRLGNNKYDAFIDILHDIRRSFEYGPRPEWGGPTGDRDSDRARASHVSRCAGRVAQLLRRHPRLARDVVYFLPAEHQAHYLATLAELQAHEAARMVLRRRLPKELVERVLRFAQCHSRRSLDDGPRFRMFDDWWRTHQCAAVAILGIEEDSDSDGDADSESEVPLAVPLRGSSSVGVTTQGAR
jgi:hypothetical protein